MYLRIYLPTYLSHLFAYLGYTITKHKFYASVIVNKLTGWKHGNIYKKSC